MVAAFRKEQKSIENAGPNSNERVNILTSAAYDSYFPYRTFRSIEHADVAIVLASNTQNAWECLNVQGDADGGLSTVSIDGERGDWTEHESLRLGGCGGGDMGWWAVAHVIGISFLDVEFAPD